MAAQIKRRGKRLIFGLLAFMLCWQPCLAKEWWTLSSFFADIRTQFLGHSTCTEDQWLSKNPPGFRARFQWNQGASGFWTKQLLSFQSLWREDSHCWLSRPCCISQSSIFPLKAYLLYQFCSSREPWLMYWLTTQQNNTAPRWHWGWTTHRKVLLNLGWQDAQGVGGAWSLYKYKVVLSLGLAKNTWGILKYVTYIGGWELWSGRCWTDLPPWDILIIM